MPEFSQISITRADAINEVISSIAMEELALSHIINAEGEKLQYALGTLDGSSPAAPATLEEILAINESIKNTLLSASENQTILKNKLQTALSSAVLTGPTGATGATGVMGATGPTGATGERGATGEEGERGPEGAQGIQGVAGTVGTILGSYDTVGDLRNAHPTGNPGEFYYVNPDLYVWDEVSGDWLDIGQIAGPQGIQGIQGERGDPGTPGRDGIDGIDGTSATVDVGTVTEIPNGQTPTVVNSGTTTNAILDFGIPAAPPPMFTVYKANLSSAMSSLVIPLGGAINYDLRYLNAGRLQLYFLPQSGITQAVCDYRIVSQYDPTSIITTYFNAMQGDAASFNANSPAIDSEIYSNSQETHLTWIRVRNPASPLLWSTYEIKLFISAGGARTIVWVTTIEENGSYT